MIAGTFAYVLSCTVRNRVRVRLKRLRQPRYLLGTLVALVYFYSVFFRRRAYTAGAPSSLLELAGEWAPGLGGLVLFVVVALVWLIPGSERAIAFSRAEVQFFFTAPISRRNLVHYKLLRSTFGGLVSSVIMTVMIRPGSLGSGLRFAASIGLLISVLTLHFMGASLTRASSRRLGAAGLVRRWLPAALIAGGALTLIAVFLMASGTLSSSQTAPDFFRELRRLTTTGLGGVVLWPFRTLVALPFAATGAAFLRCLPAVLLLVVLNYVWVMATDTAFEEAVAARAEKNVGRRGAPRMVNAKAAPAPFSLAAEGRVETAIVWKNLILLGRYASLRMLGRLLAIAFALALVLGRSGHGGIAASAALMCMMFFFMTVFAGPQMMRNDLRRDLANLAVLKTWPIRGATLFRGEVLAPAVVLSAVAIVLALGAVALGAQLSSSAAGPFKAALGNPSYPAAALLLAPALILCQLVAVNGMAVLFPAWANVGASRARGFDVMGQRMLMMAGIWLTLLVAILPAAVVAALVVLAGYWITHQVAVLLPAIAAAATMAVECWLAAEALGRVLDRTDVAAIEAVE